MEFSFIFHYCRSVWIFTLSNQYIYVLKGKIKSINMNKVSTCWNYKNAKFLCVSQHVLKLYETTLPFVCKLYSNLINEAQFLNVWINWKKISFEIISNNRTVHQLLNTIITNYACFEISINFFIVIMW